MVTETGMKFAIRDGVKLAYVDAGTGDPPLLFIHGWCCSHIHWRDQIPEFAKRHRVVAVDLRGLGDSDAPDEDSSVAQFVDDVAWLAREIGLEKPVLIGHSMGGQIVLNVVRKHPGLACGAVFVDAVMMPLSDQFKPMMASMIEGMKSPAYRDITTNFVKGFLFSADSPTAMKDETAEIMAAAPQRLIHSAIASTMSEANMTPGAIPVPSLFIRAATLPATEDELKQRYPGMEVTTVDCAHFIQMEKPAEFNAILREFIERVA